MSNQARHIMGETWGYGVFQNDMTENGEDAAWHIEFSLIEMPSEEGKNRAVRQ
jgi:hypothetical protein